MEFSTIRYDHSSTSRCTFYIKKKKENVFQSQSWEGEVLAIQKIENFVKF
jgi:hypothetical protein